jgi:hypothetical protein
MAGKSASLLTQTQRNRIQDDFEELTEEKQRRDQQRIRERVRAGLADFQLLADYPDRQFALAFDDTSEEELQDALADTTIVIERLCELHGIERAQIIDEARTHAETFSETSVEVGSLGSIDLRTDDEIQRQAETEVEERLGTSIWDKRADRLAKLAASTFIPVALIGAYSAYINEVIDASPVAFPYLILLYLLAASLIGWLLITAAQTVKYDLAPALAKLNRNPKAVVRETLTKIVERVIKNPRKTIRESWNKL